MKIRSIHVTNYKGFADSGDVILSPGLNLIVGQNNAGKTALLETFRFGRGTSNPHRNKQVLAGVPLNPHSTVHTKLSVTGDELLRFVLSRNLTLQLSIEERNDEEAVRNFFNYDNIELELSAKMGSGGFGTERYPSHGLFDRQDGSGYAAQLEPQADRQWFTVSFSKSRSDNLPAILTELVASRTFAFRAERLNVGTSSATDSAELRPDASNLPTALAHFAGVDPYGYRRFIDAVNIVLPSVKYVSSVANGGTFELKVWTIDPAEGRPDLAVPLQDSGTGVGQVLAILYVILTLPPSLLVIDEPNSFLHPGAAKKLLDIMRQYSHQYVISTHSSEIIAAAGDPALVHLVTWTGEESQISRASGAEVADAKRLLAELGSSLGDVFGADRIIWVEGYTEEATFPSILRAALGFMPPGLAIRAVKNTGDFEGRRSQLAWDVYNRLSTSHALVPPAIAYAFDRERRTQTEMDDLVRQSKGVVRFLPRRTFESYLVHAPAIEAVLLSEGREPDRRTIERMIVSASEGHPGGAEAWAAEGDAVGLLVDIFSTYQVEYRKTKHSPAITEWMLGNAASHLAELSAFVASLVSAPKA